MHSNALANDPRLGGVCHRYVVKRAVMMHLIRVGLPSAVYGDPNAPWHSKRAWRRGIRMTYSNCDVSLWISPIMKARPEKGDES